MKLKGLTAVLTGASRGLGRYIAEALWREGANLMLVARSEEAVRDIYDKLSSSTNSGQFVHVIDADLSGTYAVDEVLAHIEYTTSYVDILINNAAIQGPIGPLADNDWTDWTDTIQVNLLAPVALCKACIPLMAKRGKGKIVNLSGGGATGPRANFSAYATAKAGLVRFTETLAEEVRSQYIDVNCVAPGAMATHMLDTILAAGPERVGKKEYQQAQKLNDHSDESVLLNAAQLCVFLSSAESDGITGKLISAVWDPWRTLAEHRETLLTSDIYTLRRITPKDRGLDWNQS